MSFTKQNHINKVFCKVRNISLFGNYSLGFEKVFPPLKSPPCYSYWYLKIPFKIDKSFLEEALKCKHEIKRVPKWLAFCLWRGPAHLEWAEKGRHTGQKGLKRRRQKHWCFVYFITVAWSWPWNSSHLCWLRNIVWEKNLTFQSFTLSANGFLFPRLKTRKWFFFPLKCSMPPIKPWTSQKLGGQHLKHFSP